MLVFDLESDRLLAELTRVHCINIVDRTTGDRLRFNDVFDDAAGSVEAGVRLLQEAADIGGHNVIGFDIPAIQKVYPWFNPKGRVRDSMVEARLIWTTIADVDHKAVKQGKRPRQFLQEGLLGTHKLAAWGYRLGEYKGDFKGPWDTFTREMDDYCAQDVEVTVKLFDLIDSKGYPKEPLELETAVAWILALQERHGFLFDRAKAEDLLQKLMLRRAELEDQLRTVFRPWYEPERYKGEPVVLVPKTDNRKLGYVKDAPLTKVVLQTFNPASRQMISSRMAALFGWKPVEFTPSGQAKVDETTLAGLDYPEAKLLVDYLTVDKRLGQLAEGDQAWLKLVGADGRIHGRVNPMGTITHRMSHMTPNMAQVPACSAPYGEECRELFTVPPGYDLVGVDAEGVQLRGLGHYMARFDGGAFAEAVANGDKKKGTDAHTINQKIIGLNLRDSAKTWIYAYLLGAGGWKLGSICYDDFTDEQRATFNRRYPPGDARDEAFVRLGNKAKRKIEAGLPALRALQDLIQEKAKRGYIKGLDGRIVMIRSLHSALASVLQSYEAVIMKRALVLAHREFLSLGWVHGVDFAWVANVHDEFQIEVKTELAEEAGRIAARAIQEAGRIYGSRCPLAGEYKRGRNWRDTH